MKRGNLIAIIGLFAFIAVVGGLSYSYFVYNKEVANTSLETGSISIDLSNINGNLSLSNVIPMSDYQGMNSSSYIDFTVNATVDTEGILYELQIVKEANSTINDRYVKLYLTDQNNNPIMGIFTYNELYNSMANDGKSLYQYVIEKNGDESVKNYHQGYRLRMWIDENYPELNGKIFSFNINLHAINTKSSNLMYGLGDIGETTANRIKYSIDNEVVTVTSTYGGGAYGYTTGRVELEAGKTYIFHADTDGEWVTELQDNNSVRAYLMHLDYVTASDTPTLYKQMEDGTYEFSSQVSGTYKLRFDIYGAGTTHKFWNITIKEKENEDLLKVTFNTQDKREKGLVKYVAEGENYGSLPALNDREGYNFLGWNGKNMFNEHDWLLAISGATYTDNHYVFRSGAAYNIYGRNSRLPIYDFKENTRYTYTITGYVSGNRTIFGFSYDNDEYKSNNFTRTNEGTETYTSESNLTVDKTIMSYGTSNTTYISHIQLEEGTESTSFEPYFVDNNIIVTQQKNHELKGIWEWNNYRFNDVIQDRTGLWTTKNQYQGAILGYAQYRMADLGQIDDLSKASIQVTAKTNSLNTDRYADIIVGNFEQGGLGIHINDTNKIAFEIELENGNSYIKETVESQNEVDTTSIHDYTGVYDGQTLKLYIDGVLDATTDVSEIISNNNLTGAIKNPNNNTPMTIGCNPNGASCDASGYYTGDVYSVRIYDYAISQDKIRENIRNDGFVN